MGITLSDEAKANFVKQNVSPIHIDDIEKNAVYIENAELVAKQANILRGNRFNSDAIVEFACSPAPNDVLEQVIHDSGKLIRAWVDRDKVTQIANDATHVSSVSYILSLAEEAKEICFAFDKGEATKSERDAAGTKVLSAIRNLSIVTSQSKTSEAAAFQENADVKTTEQQQSPAP